MLNGGRVPIAELDEDMDDDPGEYAARRLLHRVGSTSKAVNRKKTYRDPRRVVQFLAKTGGLPAADDPELPAKAKRRAMMRQGPMVLKHAHEPTDKSRRRVRALCMLGVSQDMIAEDIGVSTSTLTKHYGNELRQGRLEAYAQVAGRLFKKAMDGDTISMIFWMKANPHTKWADKPDQINHTHTHTISHEERLRLLEQGPVLEQAAEAAVAATHDDDDDEDGLESGMEPRFTEDGGPIIHAEPADAMGDVDHLILTEEERIERANQVDRGE